MPASPNENEISPAPKKSSLNDWESFDGATSASARAHRARIEADPETTRRPSQFFPMSSDDGSQKH
jgi:hypothetical protein